MCCCRDQTEPWLHTVGTHTSDEMMVATHSNGIVVAFQRGTEKI